MGDLAELLGATLGTMLFNGAALGLTRAWPMSVSKVLTVGALVFLVLTLADNAIRGTEPFLATAARIGIAQIIVTAVLLIPQLRRRA